MSPTRIIRSHRIDQEPSGARVLPLEPVGPVARRAEAMAPGTEAAVPGTESGDRARSLLSYTAHELRNPLTAMLGMMDLLRETQLLPDQREMLAVVHHGAQSLVGIVNNVLDLSRLEAGRMELDLRPFDLRACIEEVLELQAATALQKGLELAYLADEATPPRVLGDGGRIRQVLTNLVGNAVKFTEQGHVTVSLATRRLPDGRLESLITVVDTGPGIRPDRLEAVFGEYIQADVQTAARYGGSGLGLSICRRLVEMMDGRIWAESDGATGTAVHFTFIARSAEGASGRVVGRQPALFGKRVLVLHDDLTVGRMLTDLLGRWGIQARLGSRSPDVVEWLQGSDRYDLILLDQRLGTVDGRSLARAIRKVPGLADVPLILLTAMDGRAASAADPEVRFAAYLGKPIRPARLHEVLIQQFAAGASALPVREREPVSPAEAEPEPVVCTIALRSDTEPTASREGTLAGWRILLADDDYDVRHTLVRLMRAAGAEVQAVADGAAALEAFPSFNPDVLILDGAMPVLDGFETCRRLRTNPDTRLTPVVLVTGFTADADRMRGIEAGADDIIHKPCDWRQLIARVRVLAERKQFTDGLDRAESALVTMARCIELRDADTHGHCDRLSTYASRLGERLGLDGPTINALRLGGIIHDIGKVAVPDAILFKEGPLTDEEWKVMQMHPVEGERICGGLTAFRRVLPIIRHHHERMDGSGYPDGLKGDEIPLSARVLQMVDIYDALTTRRPYKLPISSRQALDLMEEEVQRGWRDPAIFRAFREMVLEEEAEAAAPALEPVALARAG